MKLELPPGLETFLARLGLNTGRLKWKLHFFNQRLENVRRRWAACGERQRYKACRCGHLALATHTDCPCGRRLPSYAAYRIYRLLGFREPGFTPVTAAFISVILAIFCWQAAVFGAGTLMYPSIEALIQFGAFRGDLFWAGDYWRAFSLALVHIGLLHIAFNAVALMQLLPVFEEELGPWTALLIITLTQLGAVAASIIFMDARVTTAGASGVGFGLIGFGIAYYHRQGSAMARSFYWRWFIYGMVFGFVVGANHYAHLGGFVAGVLLGLPLGGRFPSRTMLTALRAAGMACLPLWLAALGFLSYYAIANINPPIGFP